MSKTSEQTRPAIRALQDSELDLVTGGIVDGCIRLPTVLEPWIKPTGWTFKDVFAKHTIG